MSGSVQEIDWQAISAVTSAVLAAIAVRVAFLSLAETRRQQQLAALPALRVEAPSAMPSVNTKDVSVAVTSVGIYPALDVRVEIFPEYDRGKPVPDHPAARSPAVPVLAGEIPISLPVRVTSMANFEGPDPYRFPWMRVEVRCRSQLGATVKYVYGWPPNDSAVSVETPGMGERWTLRRVEIYLPGETKPIAYDRERV